MPNWDIRQRLLEANAETDRSEQSAEELRSSIIKLTGDKFALWSRHEQVAA